MMHKLSVPTTALLAALVVPVATPGEAGQYY